MSQPLPSVKHRTGGECSGRFLASRFFLPALLASVGLLSFYLTNATNRVGDEFYYYRTSALLAKFIASAVQLESVDYAELVDQVIERGWFVPGMTVLLTPIQLLCGGEAPFYAIRAYLTLVNLILLFLIVRELLRLGVPKRLAYLAVVVPCAVPYYLFFLGMMWGDLIGVHMAILLLLHLERRILQGSSRCTLDSRTSLTIGSLIGVAALIRPQYFLLLFIVLVRLVFQEMHNRADSGNAKGKWGGMLGSALLVLLPMVLALAPWNYAINRRFGAAFMVTSMYQAPLFGDEAYVAVAIEEVGDPNRFHAVHQKLISDARLSGHTHRQQADLEVAKLPEVGLRGELRDALVSLGSLYLWENHYLGMFLAHQKNKDKYTGAMRQALLTLNRISWYSLVSLGFLAFCWPAFPKGRNYSLALSLKGLVFLLTVQPYVGSTHGRYHVALVPVFAVAILLAFGSRSCLALRELRSNMIHHRLVAGGQAFAFCYGLGTVCALVYVWMYLRPSVSHLF